MLPARTRFGRESASAGTIQEAANERTLELEDAVAQLTRMVGQLQVERETLWRDNETSARRLALISTGSSESSHSPGIIGRS